jgi:hypothetical protein
MAALDDLESRLRAFSSAPFLFVGAGLSRRYLNLDGWEDLLRRMAAFTGRPYQYFATKANNDLPRTASEIAIPFHELWFADTQFTESRAEFADQLTTAEGPLKAEVARYIRNATAAAKQSAQNRRELDLLGRATVDGAITTNYDELLEATFPDFIPYVGQDELLFADSRGIGEIYKIHGSIGVPESLVLTERDYAAFNERNPYLAAKLLTTFVEHPVIFLGYRLSDPNVATILVSIARVLTADNLTRLTDHLIFVKWDFGVTESSLVTAPITVGGFTLPVVLVTVSEFEGIFEVLARLPRKFPARLLRRLKDHVYQLVLSKEPDTRLHVVDIEDDTHAEEIDVVFGVGVQRHLDQVGYVGITRLDLLQDVLAPQSAYDPVRVVRETLPRVLRGHDHTPLFRYLRDANLVNKDGTLRANADVHPKVRDRAASGASPFRVFAGSVRRADRLVKDSGDDFPTLAATQPVADVLLATLALSRKALDLEALRKYLQANASAFNGNTSTAWAKAACLYDYLRYGAVGGT